MLEDLVACLQDIVGPEYVLHLPEDLLVFEYDGSIDRGLPAAVVLPRTTEEVAAVVRLAREAGQPLVPRGAGTGLSGGAIPLARGIIVALTRMREILEIDPENRLAVVEPGVVNLDISRAAAAHGLFYAPDPSSQRACTIGGNVAENSGGPHCLAYGVTTNHVLALEVVLPTGEVVWLGDRTGEAPGYDLRGVFIGSEGTLGIATRIVVRLLPRPEATRTMLAIYDRIEDAGATVSDIIGRGVIPAAVEMLDRLTIQAVEPAVHAGYPDDAGAVLLIEVEGLREQAAEQGETVVALCQAHGAREVRTAEAEEERERLWAGRKGALGALGRLAPNYYILDGVVPRSKLPQVLQQVTAVGEKYGFPIANVFHAGDGNLHPNILFDERAPGAIQRVLEAGAEIMRICVDAGGALSGEHGIGIEKQDFMAWVFSPEDLAAMARLRPAFGADDAFNPGKVFPGARAAAGEIPQAIAQRAVAMGAYI
ncbi:MAG: FAD-binding protein [Chloroflexi bacterium]|nr:FAD-binding protein [Chloroflexota bacterium]